MARLCKSLIIEYFLEMLYPDRLKITLITNEEGMRHIQSWVLFCPILPPGEKIIQLPTSISVDHKIAGGSAPFSGTLVLVSRMLRIVAYALTHPRPFPLPNSGEGRENPCNFGCFPLLPALGEGAGDEGVMAGVQIPTDKDTFRDLFQLS